MNPDIVYPQLDFFSSHHFPYYIAAPDYRYSSAGTRALHYLCHILNSLGYEAYITANVRNPKLRTPKLNQSIRSDHRMTGRVPIAVYPEIADGNMLDEPIVARWIMNQPGHINNQAQLGTNELIFFWADWLLTDQIKGSGDRFFVPTVDETIFNDIGLVPESRSGFCYYAHKYILQGGVIAPRICEQGTSLCRDIPRSPAEIAGILRTSKVIYCYEPSDIIREASFCGCPHIMVDTAYSRKFKLDNFYLINEDKIDLSFFPKWNKAHWDKVNAKYHAEAWCTLNNFIKKTQAAAHAYSGHSHEPEYLLQTGERLFRGKNFAEAIELFSNLLSVLPKNPLPPAYLAFICAHQGLGLEAQDFIKLALNIAPERVDLKAKLGEAFMQAGRSDLAVGYLSEALAVQPELWSAYPVLARALSDTGQREAAIALLRSRAHFESPARLQIQETLFELMGGAGNAHDNHSAG